MLLAGLTGGIATGKSTVSRLFVECGSQLIDADVLAREVVKLGRPALQQIVDAFGKDMLRPDGTLDRDRLGKAVFGDAKKLAQLNAIVHPDVAVEQERRCREIAAKTPHAVVIYDAALLIEANAHPRMDRLIIVTADEQTQIARLQARDRLSTEEARTRIAAQMPLAEKVKLADYVIDGTLPSEKLRAEVRRIYEDLTRQA
ncbi:MAG TPA: dephospho-CoA kinase [Nitrospirales bacterium]|jgi:dephospho-CoA kinase|nr:dephospho-CoA kinase [Nitrospirales bacterium]